MTLAGIQRRLGNQYKLSNLVPLVREMLQEVTCPGGVPPSMQEQQIDLILYAYTNHLTAYQARIVP